MSFAVRFIHPFLVKKGDGKMGKHALTWIVLAALMTGFVVPVNTVQAQNTWHVSVTGDDGKGDGSYAKPWRTIQHAIERAGQNDTIIVGTGVYDEQLNITKRIKLTSPTGDYATSNVVLTGSGSNWSLITIGSGASGTVIQGFRFEKVSSTEAVIFGGVGAHNIIIRSNSFTHCIGSAVFLYDTGDRNSYKGWLIANNRIDGILGTGKAGLWLGALTDSEIIGNSIYRTGGPGIVFHHVENVTVSKNKISNFLVAGILVAETTFPRWCSRLFVLGNLIDGTVQRDRGQVEAPDGIQLVSYASDVQIVGNALTSNARGCVVFGDVPVAPSVKVSFNSIYKNAGYGVQNLSGGQLNATNNWWGANNGPGGVGGGSGDAVSAGVQYDPWLRLGVVAEPKSVVIGGSATLEVVADMTKNSQDEYVAKSGHVFDGTEIIFTTEKGTFENKDTKVVKITDAGRAVAVLTSGNEAGGVAVCAEAPHHSAVPSEQCRRCVQVNFIAGAAQSVSTATGTGKAVFASSIGNISDLSAFTERDIDCSGKPKNVSFLHGLFSFSVVDIAPGSTVVVNITLPAPTPGGTQFWQCGGKAVWQQLSVGSNDGDNTITINVTDGGMGDSDGAANGVIAVRGGSGVSGHVPTHLEAKVIKIEPNQVYTSQNVKVRVKLVNKGSAPDVYSLVAKVNGQEEHEQEVRVEGRSYLWYEFSIAKAQPGTYVVSIDSKQAMFKVLVPGERPKGKVSGWLIGAVSAGAVVLAGGAAAWWLTRRSRKTVKQQ